MKKKLLNTCACEAEAVQEQQMTATICLNADLRITYINGAAEVLFSVGARLAVGLPLSQLASFPPTFLDRMQDVLSHERRTTEREVRVQRPGQNLPTLIDCTISTFLFKGEPPGLLLEIHSIDHQIKIARENALLSQQEISRNLLRGLAHEIKNPLGGIRGAAQLLERELDEESLQEYTSIVIREADRLHNLIDRMLGPHTRPRPTSINIHEALEYVRTLIRAEAPEGVVLKTDYDPSIPDFTADRDHMIQVFLNITGNALQALNGQGRILFKTRVARYVTIGSKLHKLVGIVDIEDDGPGIPEEISASIFYPMITGRADGTGLGLSIAQSLVNQQGGIIECRSQPGQTVFSVLIPLEVKDVS
ncbi:MAG TPA: PAS domain-containing sensor histidine kinase [Gammaproteobacteria bacterium]|nr:PAS domain-containing sensor histidine kinase [Gammaproteobacteria bacterium]